ncbi:P-loop containing nucleoside triphosphate hydrolase protein [Cristinia sonorae]|uniref:P-loop containing nucleoside triphosphate hydrolase protein n=1 Tax=Cristinia sonorae TaxID=1940300 RepID=A0A8K0UW01_9AGAR|nr:P-loop containing nucleoside triphosphate hydrolase protein [Cristinia sonorae]
MLRLSLGQYKVTRQSSAGVNYSSSRKPSLSIMEGETPTNSPLLFQPRAYQQELLDDSLRRNLIIALDTGSGKTHIAVLRMKLEAERNPFKISWFLAPTVALIEQQKDVIASAIPVSVGIISGASEPDQWKDAGMWRRLLETHRIIVSTPQILLDALNHGYVKLYQIGLLVFDEAHHATSKHPYNIIMSQYYFHLPPPTRNGALQAMVRPMVLGLTASPIYGGDVELAFRELERNLDSVVRSSQRNRHELATHVHRPVFEYVKYPLPPFQFEEIGWRGPSRNVIALQAVVSRLNIDDDPYVESLRAQLSKLQPTSTQWKRVDQKLSKVLSKRDTFTHKGLQDLLRAAGDICYDLGPWAADWYISTVIDMTRSTSGIYSNIMASWQEKEKRYLLSKLAEIEPVQVSHESATIYNGLSARVRKLVSILKREEGLARAENEPYSGILFVTRRDSVLALSHILTSLPETSELFRIGCMLGSSNSFKRHSFLDISRALLKETPTEILRDFRNGDKNLIVSTAVAEEGIDIQACGSVIRFDPPDNMVAWAQSRGRARRRKSRFVIMFDEVSGHSRVEEWEKMERQMLALYTSNERERPAEEEDADEKSSLYFRVESTGATLTLNSVMGHLFHFCAVLPSSGHGSHLPYFELDPPDFPDEWHATQAPMEPSTGPWRATCILPRVLPPHLRTFTTDFTYSSKLSAQKHAAFEAYVSLYENGLLNDNLLPFTSVIEGDSHEEVKLLLEEVEKRAGTENVPVQMDPWFMPGQTKWFCYELAIGSLPPMSLFTRQALPAIDDDELPTLYVPGYAPIQVKLQGRPDIQVTDDMISQAEEYTERLFWSLHSSRMIAGKRDFVYMFLPVQKGPDEVSWEIRRQWMKSRRERSENLRSETIDKANAALFGQHFQWPLDLSIVRSNDKISKALRFIGWHDGPISDGEAEELRQRYEDPELEIVYPLLVAQELPRRVNFLIPLADENAGLRHEEPFLLVPSDATVDLLSRDDLEYAMYLPSVLRGLSKVITAASLRDSLFTFTPLYDIPLEQLTVAITAPVSQETNYQRLETLGDTVLKYTIGIQLFAEHPWWHEGYLSRRKDHAVNNNRLAKDAVEKGLYKWIIRDRYVPRKWRPRYLTDQLVEPTPPPEPVPEEQEERELTPKERRAEARRKNKQQLSTKVMADIVESLMGAAYEYGGFDLAIDTARLFGLGLPSWQPIAVRIEQILSRVEEVEGLPSQLGLVERMIGYEFTHKMLLVEALTHASYQGDLENVSYERLEFLGDAALDMVVTHFLYHAPGKNYSPGHMHLRKEALVNSHFLAFLCLDTSLAVDTTIPVWTPSDGLKERSEVQSIHLYQCLLHSSHLVMEDQTNTFRRYEKNGDQIKSALMKSSYYPWAALTSLQAPKFISDLMESLIGAVFLDARGDLDAVRGVLKKLGMYAIMERIVDQDVDVLHPISRLAIWCAKQDPQKKLEVRVEKDKGNVTCTVLVDEEVVAQASERYRGKMTRNGVRFAAADDAIRKLGVIEQETPEDIDDVGWPEEVPEYEW